MPSPVVEVDYWLTKLGGPQVWGQFVADVVTGAYRLLHPSEDDLLRAAELENRHFSVVKPRHCPALELRPN